MPEQHRRPKTLTLVAQLRPEDRITAYCACGRSASVSARTLVRRFHHKTDFAAVALALVCKGTRNKPGCGRHSPSLLCFHDDRVSWLNGAEHAPKR